MERSWGRASQPRSERHVPPLAFYLWTMVTLSGVGKGLPVKADSSGTARVEAALGWSEI